MSVRIGSVHGPSHNSPGQAIEVWCSAQGVELNVFADNGPPASVREGISKRLDPVAARNLAALLVRGAEESEMMRARIPKESRDG